MLAVGINPGDSVAPISTPDVYVDGSIYVTVQLGCMFCRPRIQYTVQVEIYNSDMVSVCWAVTCKWISFFFLLHVVVVSLETSFVIKLKDLTEERQHTCQFGLSSGRYRIEGFTKLLRVMLSSERYPLPVAYVIIPVSIIDHMLKVTEHLCCTKYEICLNGKRESFYKFSCGIDNVRKCHPLDSCFTIIGSVMIRKCHVFIYESMLLEKESIRWSIETPWFSIKVSSCQYRISLCGHKRVVKSSNLHNCISYTAKMASSYWTTPDVFGWNYNQCTHFI